MDKKKIGIIVVLFLVVIGIACGPKVYDTILEKKAQNALVSDATASIKKICEKYGIDEYKMEVVFPEWSDVFYYINLTAYDSDISQSQISSFTSEVWNYDYEDPEHFWSRSTSGEVKVNNKQSYAGGLTAQEWWEKESTSNQTTGYQVTDSGARHTDSEAWSCAKNILKDSLKSPSTAKFCSFTECKVEHLSNGEYMVTGWVEAQNSYGATLRQSFVVTYTATEKGYENGVAIID